MYIYIYIERERYVNIYIYIIHIYNPRRPPDRDPRSRTPRGGEEWARENESEASAWELSSTYSIL